jgi:hypothetical protein
MIKLNDQFSCSPHNQLWNPNKKCQFQSSSSKISDDDRMSYIKQLVVKCAYMKQRKTDDDGEDDDDEEDDGK